MGAPRTRSTGAGSGGDLRRSWAVYGAVLVAVVAGVLHLLGAESAEVVGTLLFAAVFGATLLGGRLVGLVTAGVATVVYTWLRRDAFDEVGAVQLAIVAGGRAASYFVLAHVTHVMRNRLPRVPVLTFSTPGRAGPSPDENAAYAVPGGQGDPNIESEAYGSVGYAGDSYGGEDYRSDPYGPGPDVYGPDYVTSGYGPAPEESWVGGNGHGAETAAPDPYAPPAGHWAPAADLDVPDLPPPVEGLGREQPPPPVPAGWMEPEDYGEEVPVGHTGELFLQDLAVPPEQAASGPGQPYDPYDHQGHQVGLDDPYETPLVEAPPAEPVPHIDPETRLWTAGYFRDRLLDERERSRVTGTGFSVVMIQIPDTPFQTLSYRREVALLRELGHQFIRAQVVDHLVHLPDQGQHWFAVVLPDTDKTTAHGFERRLRAAIAGYLRNRGLGLDDVQSAALTSPDDDEMMSTIWSSLLGESMQDQAHAAWGTDSRW